MMPFYHNENRKKIKNVTLQVRILRKTDSFWGKRVSSAFSAGCRAGLTVEAALCLSLFVFFTVSILVPLKIMNTQRQIQAVLEAVGEEYSQYGYILNRMEQGKDDISDTAGWDREILEVMAQAAGVSYVEAKLRKAVSEKAVRTLSMEGTQILQDAETLRLRAVYRLKLPFPVFRVTEIPASSICCRRLWIGRDGGRSGDGGSGQEDETVYISKNPTCYHRLRECRYLCNDIRPMAFEDLGTETNSEGNRYRPCVICGAQAGKGETVYAMSEGERYHSDRYCSSIVAYVRAVPLSEVKELGACSGCGGKE